MAFQALFLKSEPALHVTCYKYSYRDWHQLNLCEQQLKTLISYIENSFQLSAKNSFIKINAAGYSDFDAFFEAKGSFSMFRTCNVWVNNALKRCKIKTSVWSPFDKGVLYHLPD